MTFDINVTEAQGTRHKAQVQGTGQLIQYATRHSQSVSGLPLTGGGAIALLLLLFTHM